MAILLKDVLKAGYTIDPIEQQTDAWHAWRALGLGASSVPTILGENPWETPYQLWAEKCGFVAPKDLSGNPHIRRGVDNEDPARDAWEARHNEFTVAACAVNNYAPWLRVSYDGITLDGRVLEIKCPSPKKIAWLKERHAEGIVAGSYDELENLGFGHYYGQTQYQMVVAGSLLTHLWIWDVEEQIGYEVIIPLNEEYAQDMLEKAEAFWDGIQTCTPPELDPKRDVLNTIMLDIDAKASWDEAEASYMEVEAELKKLEAELKELKSELDVYKERMVGVAGIWPKVESESGLKLTTFARSGTVDYPALLAEYLPNLTQAQINKYRKKGSISTRITVPKLKLKEAKAS